MVLFGWYATGAHSGKGAVAAAAAAGQEVSSEANCRGKYLARGPSFFGSFVNRSWVVPVLFAHEIAGFEDGS